MSEWRYGHHEIGPCETRHEAIGRATIRAGPVHPADYWQYVHAIHHSDLCGGSEFFVAHSPADGDPTNRCLHCGERVEA